MILRANQNENNDESWWRYNGGGLAQLVATLVRSKELLYAGPVNTWMGDPIGVQLPVWEIYLSLSNHHDQLSHSSSWGSINE